MIIKSIVALSVSFGLSFGIATGISVYNYSTEFEISSQADYDDQKDISVPDETFLNQNAEGNTLGNTVKNGLETGRTNRLGEFHMAGDMESMDISEKSIEPIAVRMGEILARMSPMDAASILASVDSTDLQLIMRQLPQQHGEAVRKHLGALPRRSVTDSASLLGSKGT